MTQSKDTFQAGAANIVKSEVRQQVSDGVATASPLTPGERLRCLQAALDVVLDGVELMQVQVRLVADVGTDTAEEICQRIRENVEHYRRELLDGADFRTIVRDARDRGQDLIALSKELGVPVQNIINELDDGRRQSVQL